MKAFSLVVPLLALILVPTLAPGRTWTSSDGKKIEAEFVSSNGKEVTIRKAGGKSFTFPLERLSEDDRSWVSSKLKDMEEEKSSVLKAKGLTGKWERREEYGVEYRLFGGTGLDPEKSYPLVIYLHGKNGNVMEPEQPGQARTFSSESNYQDRPCIIMAPQSPGRTTSWSGELASNVVKVAKKLMKDLPVDEDRVYVTGYSMGGYGTFYLLGSESKMFAAGVPIAGGGSTSAAREMRKIPIWVFHGDKDPTVPVEQSRDMVEALEKARAPVKYTEYPGEGHGIAGMVYKEAELHAWLFSQKRK